MMSSSLESQSKTEELFKLGGSKTIPAFGLHPWFTGSISTTNNLDKRIHYRNILSSSSSSSSSGHQKFDHHQNQNKKDHQVKSDLKSKEDQEIEDWIENNLELLPNPISLDKLISDLKSRLIKFPNSIIGEIGLDKVFRFQIITKNQKHDQDRDQDRDHEVKEGGEEQEVMIVTRSNFKISMTHQLIILRSQIELAIELSRPVSLHCVQASNELIDLIQELIIKWGTKLTGPIVLKKKIKPLKKSRQRSVELLCSSSSKFINTHDDQEVKINSNDKTLPRNHPSSPDHHSRSSLGIKICWHSANISIEVLDRIQKLLPNSIYFSYSNDLAILSVSRSSNSKNLDPNHNDDGRYHPHFSELGSGMIVDIDQYSKRVSRLIQVTPIDRLLIESDHGSDPILIDHKLIKILTFIYLIKFPPLPSSSPTTFNHYHLYSQPEFLS